MFDSNAELAMASLSAEEDNLMYALWLAKTRQRWDEVHGMCMG